MRNEKRYAGLGRRLGWAVGSFVLSAVMIVFFQNCSQPVAVDDSAAITAQAAKIDFAYDSAVDQIAYMSCASAAPGTYDSGAFFTFRVGAYRNGGVRLTDSFRTEMKLKSTERQTELLSASPANAYTNLQIALRDTTNYQGVLRVTDPPKRGEDFVNIFEPLGTGPMCTTLVESDPTVRLKYLRNGTVWGSRMEGSLLFTHSPVTAESVRQKLRNDVFLALTYTQAASNGNSSETMARSPADVFENYPSPPTRSVYGKGFNVRFGQPTTSGLYAQFPTNVLTEVVERNLKDASDSTANGSWTCPSILQFRIVKYEDFAIGTPGINCVAAPDPLNASVEVTQLLQLARNSLRQEDWYIDMTNRCIIPKKPSTVCYPSNVNVKYDQSLECGTTANPQPCVNYASICYRN